MLLLSRYWNEYSMSKQKRDIEETFRCYYRSLCLYAMHYHHDMDLVEDVVQDEEAEDRSMIEARLWMAIDSLPEKCREIFLLSKRDSLKYKEIGEKLKISTKTVENQIAKAMKILKDRAIKTYNFFFGYFFPFLSRGFFIYFSLS